MICEDLRPLPDGRGSNLHSLSETLGTGNSRMYCRADSGCETAELGGWGIGDIMTLDEVHLARHCEAVICE